MPVLTIDRDQGYAVVTLNRPEARNALSQALRAALAAVVQELAEAPDVQVLVLTGAGSAFCAGLDLKEIGASDDALRSVLAARSPVEALRSFSGPVIGAINGVAAAGGFELALGCDMLLASENARFADTHGRVGLLPVWGLSQRLSRLIGIGRAKELSLTGNYLDAHTAYAWGLVNRVLPAAELLPAACALARDMQSLAPGLLAAYRKLIDDGFDAPFPQALRIEQQQAQAFNAAVSCASIEARRLGVLTLGRTQQGA
ncbi:MAG: enoyl-CoA hydratase [Ramlibacter sp.]|nr:enoyl-CoA hydratase [Ramlibacter sp.]